MIAIVMARAVPTTIARIVRMIVKSTPCMIERENSHWNTTCHWKFAFVTSAWAAIAARIAATIALAHLPGRGTGFASISSTPSLMVAMRSSVVRRRV